MARHPRARLGHSTQGGPGCDDGDLTYVAQPRNRTQATTVPSPMPGVPGAGRRAPGLPARRGLCRRVGVAS